ncbi:MAG: hypothetical protein R2813_13755 [Flavobacteriales bacterium]
MRTENRFFLDQRGRLLLANYTEGKSVLKLLLATQVDSAFAALRGGATSVISLDSAAEHWSWLMKMLS